jgi:glycosyltransferase involved in cell wall biosynthesis
VRFSPLNIWIFNHYAIAPAHVGGTRHYDLSKHLVEKGYKVTIFASSFNHFAKEEMVFNESKSHFKTEWIDGVKYVWINTPAYKGSIGRVKNILSYTLKSFKKAISDCHTDKPDIVIGSSVHPLAAIIGYLVSRKAKCKFYFEERDLWPQTFVDFGKISAGNPIAKALYKLESFLYQKADRIIVLFDKAKYYVESRGIDQRKVIYLPNGVNLSGYRQLNESVEIDQIFKGLERKFVIVYAGSHGIANHLDPIIELFSILKNNPEIHLVLVGDGDQKQEMIKRAEQNGISNLTFKDPISKSEIPYLLSKANMGIISIMDSPLYKWGFSMNKIYDYMAAGLPIIMIADPELIGPLRNQEGIHPYQELEAIKNLICKYKDSPELLKKEGATLRKYVEQHYSWGNLAVKLENTILEDCEGEIINEKIV